MSIFTSLKRRFFSKGSSVLKRILIPIFVLIVVFHFYSSSKKTDNLEVVEKPFIVPGEALDPVLEFPKKPIHKSPGKVPEKAPTKAPEKAPEKAHERPLSSTANKNKKLEDYPSPKEKILKEKPDVKLEKPVNKTDTNKVRFRPHAINEETVTLTLMSSSDKVFMSLNKKEIYRNLQDRGIHIVVLNEVTGKVMSKKVFDTNAVGVEEEMVEYLDDIRDGRIIVMAVLDEASKGLSWRGRNKLKELGARYADKLAYRDMWALVTRQGGLKMAETYSNVATADTGYEWGGPVFLRTDFDLLTQSSECGWPKNERNEARKAFCSRFEGYGAMCSCDVTNWKDVFFQFGDDLLQKELARTKLYKDLGVVILATDRPHYLFRTLRSLWEAPGLNTQMIAVYSDGKCREVKAVTKLFGVKHVVAEVVTSVNASAGEKIRHKMQRIIRDVFGGKFPARSVPKGNLPEDTIPPFSCGHLLVLEDDLQVSIDLFKYLYFVAPVFQKDPSILAASAFNYFGYRDTSSSHNTILRTDRLIPTAILLPARTIHDYIAPNWPTTSEWYSPLKEALQDNPEAAVVYPELPRARHFGYSGDLIMAGIQHNLFRDHVISLSTEYTFSPDDLHRLELSEYEKRLSATLRESLPISFDLCVHDLLYGTEPMVMYVKYEGRLNDVYWKTVMQCLRTWSVYSEAGWKGVWQFHYHGHLLSVVGVPFSPYSSTKSSNYEVITAISKTTPA